MRRLHLLILALLCTFGLFAQQAPVRWLSQPSEIALGQSWGIPWVKGAVNKNQAFILKAATGETFPVQTWPLAYWPDGTIKWSGMAASLPANFEGPFTVEATEAFNTGNALTAKQESGYIVINTGAIQAKIPLAGNHIIEEITMKGNSVVSKAHLVCTLEDRSRLDDQNIIRYEEFTGFASKVSLEQAGPVRAVVRFEGMHRNASGNREWLPFTVRLYFYAGQQAIRMTHTIIYDGEQEQDFIKGLGVVFQVPMREEVQNRHVRFTGEDGGLWAEPIQPLEGRGFLTHPDMPMPYRIQLQGGRIPNLETYPRQGQKILTDLAVWDAFKLTQLNPDGYSIVKRTGTEGNWIGTAGGNRAEGLAYVGDVSGGLAVSLKNFWQSYPASLEIQEARSDEAQLRVWMWSPDAQAMDLRHYDTIAHDLLSSYEDVQEGLSTPFGIARTSELTLYPVSSVPSREQLVAMSRQGAEPARLVSTPEYYHQAGAFGTLWGLPNRSNPTFQWIENQLDSSILYYQKMIDQHKWYGFWNYGDVMHSQDVSRHIWRYDVGGMAWANSELAPDNWLWYSFLRTGDPATFKMAEAMTRHTGEVDTYHLGPLKGLGSRHNVSHWGCGAKESRIGQAAFRRYYYYLTTDERVGDAMRQMIDAEQSIVKLDPMRLALPFEEAPVKAPGRLRFGPDWISMVSNWMTEWERTGDTKWRDKITRGMTDFAKMPNGLFSGKGVFGFYPETGEITLEPEQSQEVHSMHLATIMGGAEMMFELLTFLEHKEFEQAWLEYCMYYSMPRDDPSRPERLARLGPNGFMVPRLAAYAAMVKNDDKLAERAWREFLGRGGAGRSMYATRAVLPPDVLNPIDENSSISTNSVAQWGINGIFMPQMIGDKLPDFSQDPAPAPRAGRAGGGFGMFGAPPQETPIEPEVLPALPTVLPAGRTR